MNSFTYAVLTTSDSCFACEAIDKSGPRLVELVGECFNGGRVLHEILPDNLTMIQEKLQFWVNEKVTAIFTTGGTGFAPSDVTPEATKAVITRECPQLAMAMLLSSLQKTPFAALSRAVCGIADSTLIINFPGSLKAVVECFDAIRKILPHALQLIRNDIVEVKKVHQSIETVSHVCPHKTGTGGNTDRNSPFQMLPVYVAIETIFQTVKSKKEASEFLSGYVSPVNIPPFRASIKDGYAMKSSGFSGTKKVVGVIGAGDKIHNYDLSEDECFKINTGAPVPEFADCVVQVEDTNLLKKNKRGEEEYVEILGELRSGLDIRPVGSDLLKGANLFPSADHSEVVIKSILASVGKLAKIKKPKIAIMSTGNELLALGDDEIEGKIYDSNTTMLEELLQYFGFECMRKSVLSDDFEVLKKSVQENFESVDFIICTGGVSMGDKDFIKPVLNKIGFNINFGRVNMKPGKPMTFASNEMKEKYFFGLPGNPVSAFVTFHLFVLPAIRWASGWERDKCELATVQVILQNDNIRLDSRPEYARASVTSKNGRLYASVNGNQMSSRLQSIVGADVLIHLPGRSDEKPNAIAGDVLRASVLRYDFISKYE